MLGRLRKDGFFLLRLALAFAFLYSAYGSISEPANWIGYFPPFLLELLPEGTLVAGHAIFHTTLGLWLLSGWKPSIPSVLAFFSLSGIVAFNFSQMDIVFRDISLALVAVFLACKSFKTEKTESES